MTFREIFSWMKIRILGLTKYLAAATAFYFSRPMILLLNRQRMNMDTWNKEITCN